MRRTQKFVTNLALSALALSALALTASATPIPYLGSGSFNIGNFSVAINGNAATGCVDFYNTTTGCGTNATVGLNAPADPIFGVVGVTTGSI